MKRLSYHVSDGQSTQKEDTIVNEWMHVGQSKPELNRDIIQKDIASIVKKGNRKWDVKSLRTQTASQALDYFPQQKRKQVGPRKTRRENDNECWWISFFTIHKSDYSKIRKWWSSLWWHGVWMGQGWRSRSLKSVQHWWGKLTQPAQLLRPCCYSKASRATVCEYRAD